MATITHRQLVITFALIMGLFLAALEGTVISTAMPTIIAQLGGLEVYSWAFSSYMLASTTTIPIFGRLSDLYGRKPIYLGSIVLFLIGSALCGQAQNMTELIAFRAIQGLGAGGLLPVTFTIIGDLFTFEQRARMQGLFSSVWGVSSVIGPLCGGFLVEHVSGRWVFYLNIPFGLLAATIILLRFHEAVEDRAGGQVDYRGALLLATSVLCLLFAVLEGGRQYAWTDPRIVGLLVTAGLGCAAFIWLEQRIDEPLLPLRLFKDRLDLVASGYNFLAGFGEPYERGQPERDPRGRNSYPTQSGLGQWEHHQRAVTAARGAAPNCVCWSCQPAHWNVRGYAVGNRQHTTDRSDWDDVHGAGNGADTDEFSGIGPKPEPARAVGGGDIGTAIH